MSSQQSKPLAVITARTLNHYEGRAASFAENTQDHDVSQNYAAFLDAMPWEHPLDILDFGCGPGRDVRYFRDLGHRVMGLDGCEAFSRMAQEATGCTILHQNFLALSLPASRFHGIFANASLFHVPSLAFTGVLRQLGGALREGGILFSSNPRGSWEGWNAERYGYYMELDQYRHHLEQAGFEILSHYYRPPGKPRSQQPWLAVVSRWDGGADANIS